MDKLTNEIVSSFITKLKKKENLDKLNNDIIEPLLYFFFKKLYPYIICICIIFGLIIILLIFTILLVK